MTSTDSETDIFEALDWDFKPPCEGAEESDQCENNADYICALKCCGGKLLLCEECWSDWLDYSRFYAGARMRCGFCNVLLLLHPGHLNVVGRV